MNSNDPTTGQHDNDHDIGTVLITHHACPAPVIPRDRLKIFHTVVLQTGHPWYYAELQLCFRGMPRKVCFLDPLVFVRVRSVWVISGSIIDHFRLELGLIA